MDRGKRLSKATSSKNNKIYLDLKDIIREHCLPFLPAKSLFRFRGVCRDWLFQISAPFFAHNQSLYFSALSGIFCQSPGNPPSFISVDPKSCGVPDPSLKFLPVPVDIRSSSNGILCCQGRTGDKAYYVCNPVTKQYKKLPKPNGDHGPDPAVVLVFTPSLLNFEADYKLICPFPSTDFDSATEFEIYSSAEGSWKISGEICFASKKLVPRSGIHVNGVVYWQSQTSGILAFDLKKDRSQLIQGCYGVKGALGTMDGKLCYATAMGRQIIVNVLSNIYSNTMQMHSNVRTWEERLRIYLDQTVVGDAPEQWAVLFAGGDLLLVEVGRRIFSYDIKTRETKLLSTARDSDMWCTAYVNSLVYI